MLDNAGPRGLTVGVVDGGIALKAGLVEQLILKPDGAILQRAELVVKVGINGAGVDDLVSQCVQRGLIFEVIGVQPHLDAVQKVGNHLGVAADGNALIQSVEIVVVKGQPHGQALDDKGGQVLAVAAPLLLGVALHERLEDVAADERQRLLLEVGRLSDVLGGHLLCDLGLGVRRRDDVRPHLGEGVHVEGHVVHVAMEVGYRRVDVVVELGEAVDVVPDVPHGGVEDVRAVAVDLDALDVLGVDVAGDVVAAIDDQEVTHNFFRKLTTA